MENIMPNFEIKVIKPKLKFPPLYLSKYEQKLPADKSVSPLQQNQFTHTQVTAKNELAYVLEFYK